MRKFYSSKYELKVHFFVCSSIYLFVCLFIYLFVYLFVYGLFREQQKELKHLGGLRDQL